MALFNQNQFRAIFAWICIFLLVHYLFQREPGLSTNELTTLKSIGIDAVVFIAMGAVTVDPMIDLSVESVRSTGKYTGSIYIITDRPNCFVDIQKSFGVKIIQTEPRDSIIKIKAAKAEIFSFLPSDVNSVLYLDIDILVTRDLSNFIRDSTIAVATFKPQSSSPQKNKNALRQTGNKNSTSTSSISTSNSNSDSSYSYDMGAFLDAKGHYVGFCSGCEKWHTGILLLHRNHGAECLKAWREILLSGKFDTDQESLDEAENSGACLQLVNFPPRHLIFAKDYIGWVLTSGHTFVHLTSAARIDTQVLPFMHLMFWVNDWCRIISTEKWLCLAYGDQSRGPHRSK